MRVGDGMEVCVLPGRYYAEKEKYCVYKDRVALASEDGEVVLMHVVEV